LRRVVKRVRLRRNQPKRSDWPPRVNRVGIYIAMKIKIQMCFYYLGIDMKCFPLNIFSYVLLC